MLKKCVTLTKMITPLPHGCVEKCDNAVLTVSCYQKICKCTRYQAKGNIHTVGDPIVKSKRSPNRSRKCVSNNRKSVSLHQGFRCEPLQVRAALSNSFQQGSFPPSDSILLIQTGIGRGYVSHSAANAESCDAHSRNKLCHSEVPVIPAHWRTCSVL